MPFGLDWQRPNNTEGSAWERLRCCPTAPGVAYLPFPWASWIDAVHRRLRPTDPPLQLDPDGLRATVCQHIWALEFLPAFAAAGITDLFWSHSRIEVHHSTGIRLHPFPLFPVRCHDHPAPINLLPCEQRPLLYSFLGFHCDGLYPTATRRWLLSLPPRADALLRIRDEWHFEQQVYRQQLHGLPADQQRLQVLQVEADDYVRTLQQSCFALCPSGAGPNSIRLWEALGYGAIPVLLSESLRLPGSAGLWRQAVLVVPENEPAIAALPAQLEELRRDRDRLRAMQLAGRQIWQRYGLPGLVSDVQEFLSDPDGFLLLQAQRRLSDHASMAAPEGSPEAALAEVHLLRAEDPVLLPLQVLRWCRSAPPGSRLLVQLLDFRPLTEQRLRWRTAVTLCRQTLERHPALHWGLCSRVPELEQLAESDESNRPSFGDSRP